MTAMIVLELNELVPALMARFIAAGQLPHFARLYRESAVYATDAGEAPPNLEPWIQWVTIHSGMPFAEHGVYHLGDGHTLKAPCVWDVLSAAGLPVWLCGSMNVRYDASLLGGVMPDPWSVGAPPAPASLRPYFDFVRTQVAEHTNAAGAPAAASARFLAFMARHGLSAGTLAAIVRQRLSERGGRHRWKRAVLLDRLQFDLFRWGHRAFAPRFSTFFLNSTAHFQHLYWRNLEPAHFRVRPSATDQEEHADAILFGYRSMDALVGRFLALAGRDTTLVLATGLSQQPCLVYEDQGGKSFYRPKDFGALLAFAGVPASTHVSPVMSEQFHLFCATERDAVETERRLGALRVDGAEAMAVHRTGAAVFAGCRIFVALGADARLTVADTDRAAPFHDVFYRVDGLKSGMHHPEGMLWIRRPDRRHAVHPEPVALTSIAPTILDAFGVAPPDHMRGAVL